jgi:hypothetical protein
MRACVRATTQNTPGPQRNYTCCLLENQTNKWDQNLTGMKVVQVVTLLYVQLYVQRWLLIAAHFFFFPPPSLLTIVGTGIESGKEKESGILQFSGRRILTVHHTAHPRPRCHSPAGPRTLNAATASPRRTSRCSMRRRSPPSFHLLLRLQIRLSHRSLNPTKQSDFLSFSPLARLPSADFVRLGETRTSCLLIKALD